MSQKLLGTTRLQDATTPLTLAYSDTVSLDLAINAQGGLDISLASVTGAADGLKITNGTDNFNLVRDAANAMSARLAEKPKRKWWPW